MLNVGTRIRKIREQLGLNQAEFAKKVGVSAAAICQFENGIDGKMPSVATLQKFAKQLNIPPDYFLGAEGNKKEAPAELQTLFREFKKLNNQDKKAMLDFFHFLKGKNKPTK